MIENEKYGGPQSGDPLAGISKSESRRLLAMSIVFMVCLVFVLQIITQSTGTKIDFKKGDPLEARLEEIARHKVDDLVHPRKKILEKLPKPNLTQGDQLKVEARVREIIKENKLDDLAIKVGISLSGNDQDLVKDRLEGAETNGVKPFTKNPELIQAAEDFVMDSLEDDIFYYYLHQVVAAETKESLAKKTRFLKKRTDWLAEFGAPANSEPTRLARGNTYRLDGRLMWYRQRVLERYPNDAGLAWVWMGLMDTGIGACWIFVTDKEIEPVIGRMHGDALQIDAIFAKGYLYQTPKQPMAAPVFIGRDFKRTFSRTYEDSYPDQVANFMALIVLLTCVVACVYFFSLSREEKSAHVKHSRLRKKQLLRNDPKAKLAARAEAKAAAKPETEAAAESAETGRAESSSSSSGNNLAPHTPDEPQCSTTSPTAEAEPENAELEQAESQTPEPEAAESEADKAEVEVDSTPESVPAESELPESTPEAEAKESETEESEQAPETGSAEAESKTEPESETETESKTED